MYPKALISKLAATVLACAALAAAAGCGKTDQEQVRETTEDYIDAIAKDDFAEACDLFTDEYRDQLGGEAGCERAQADQFMGPQGSQLEIAAVRVKGDHANVGIEIHRGSGSPSPLTLLLAKEDGEWRIRGQQ